jgi:hypothetical protein
MNALGAPNTAATTPPGQEAVMGVGGVVLASLVGGGVGYLLGGKEWGVTGALVAAVAKGVLIAQKSAATS